MADAGAAPPLPTQKTRGWEFTDLSGLDLDAYTAATDGDPEARARADGVLNPPEGADHLVVQVDGAVRRGRVGRRRGRRTTARTAGRLPRRARSSASPTCARCSARWRPSDDPFVARNDGAWRGGALVYVPRGKRLEAPALISAVQDADGAARLLPHADRARGGRRGGGLGAVALHRLQPGLRSSTRSPRSGSAPAPTSATSPPRG